MNTSDVLQYFQNRVEVEWYNIRPDQFFDSIIIQCKSLDAIGSILSKRYHRIQNYIVTVELATDEEPFDSSILRNLLMKQTPFVELNSKVLAKIFNHLNVNDLCAIANTCTRFAKIAQRNFADKFNKITWRAGDMNAMNVFKAFGRLITSLDVDVIEPQNAFLDFITEHCGYKLTHLNLWTQSHDHIPLTEGTLIKLKLLFSQLYRLDIYCNKLFDWETTKNVFASCLELKSLALNCTTVMNFEMNRMNIQFPKLQELKFYLNHAINDNGLDLLLASNPNIKKLYLDECTNLTAKTIEIIAHRLPNLEELSLGYLLQKLGVQHLRPIGELKRLNSVNIILGPVLPLIHVLCVMEIHIENLMLWYVDVNDAIVERILNMKTIQSLTIYSNEHVMNYIQDGHLELLARNLPALTVLRLGYSDQVTIDGLKRFLFYAKNLTLLTLTNIRNVTTENKNDLLNWASHRPHLTIDFDTE